LTSTVQVEVAGSPVTSLGFTVEEKKNTPTTFDLEPLDPQTNILGEETTFTRNGILQLTGITEKHEQSFDPSGYSQSLCGRDFLRKLATRCIQREIFKNCAPKDIIHYLNRINKPIATPVLLNYTFDNNASVVGFVYDLLSQILWNGWWQWIVLSSSYRIKFGCYPETPPISFTHINYDNAVFDSNIFRIESKMSFYMARWMTRGFASGGVIIKYKDSDNWLIGRIRHYLDYAVAVPSYHTTDVWIQIIQRVAGVDSTILSVYLGRKKDYNVGSPINVEYDLTFQLCGTLVTYTVASSGNLFVGSWSGYGTVDSSLAGQGKTGVYVCIENINSEDAYFSWDNLKLIQTTSGSASVSGSGGFIALTDLKEETTWNSETDQLEGQWVEIDLGSPKTISAFKIIQDVSKYARNFKIQYKSDTNWIDVLAVSNSTTPTILKSFNPISARYWRVYITAAAPYHWAIQEIYVREWDGNQVLQEGTIDEYNGLVTFRVDFESRLAGMYRFAKALGWNLWAGADGKLNFQASRGSDKSASVVFQRGKNILCVDREHDAVNPKVAGKIVVVGHGLGVQTATKSPTVPNAGLIVQRLELEEINRERPESGGGGVDAGNVEGTVESEAEDTAQDWQADKFEGY